MTELLHGNTKFKIGSKLENTDWSRRTPIKTPRSCGLNSNFSFMCTMHVHVLHTPCAGVFSPETQTNQDTSSFNLCCFYQFVYNRGRISFAETLRKPFQFICVLQKTFSTTRCSAQLANFCGILALLTWSRIGAHSCFLKAQTPLHLRVIQKLSIH